jgi:hypothetical protein
LVNLVQDNGLILIRQVAPDLRKRFAGEPRHPSRSTESCPIVAIVHNLRYRESSCVSESLRERFFCMDSLGLLQDRVERKDNYASGVGKGVWYSAVLAEVSLILRCKSI